MTERVREIFETTLQDEPPLVDIVAGAVEGARLKRRRRRRERVAVAVSPLALLALGFGAYAVLPGFGSLTGGHSAASRPTPTLTSQTSAVFPAVAEDKPLNASPKVHQAAVSMCGKNWSEYLAPLSTNMMPNTQQEAVDMCVMTAETLMTLMPDAAVTLPSAPDVALPDGSGEQWVVKTGAGRTLLDIRYLWPDGTYEKKHYGPFDQCGLNTKGNEYCVQTRPAQQFYGALTVGDTGGDVAYSVVNRGYGRYMISTAVVSVAVPTKPTSGSYEEANGQYIIPDPRGKAAMSPGEFANVFLDPRFNDYLVRYEDYILTHATADSFVVSGSKPVR